MTLAQIKDATGLSKAYIRTLTILYPHCFMQDEIKLGKLHGSKLFQTRPNVDIDLPPEDNEIIGTVYKMQD
ncbi:hypothetical protein, partial [Streptococcus pneumoniae]|uniref:hypothetical protein n=1 Tax=Streptococcus pneumoniae TaxID=1313 RepID=UPI0012D73866